jgi:predicted adenylyl cyclase CyaB
LKKNYEIKCRIDDRKKVTEIKKALSKYKHSIEKQTDIYYKTSNGRLKLRIIDDTSGSLIQYNRAEKKNKRISKYTISKTKDFRELDFILKKQFDTLVTVIKKRDVYINKNVRVHLDKVKNLGSYLEIEIIYERLSDAKKQMQELITKLELDETKFIKESYSDLLINLR